jgi:PAS domain S-box-containing protein
MDAGVVTPEEVFQPKELADSEDAQEWRYLRADGSKVLMSLVSTKITDDRGAPIGYLGISRDVTADAGGADAVEITLPAWG